MKTYQQLLLSNRAWSEEIREQRADFFERQTTGQNPEILWIGCSDSRVSPEQITRTLPGEMYIHRNIANLFHADDDNLLSVLQYAVETLGVRHVILCGHYGCSGIAAATERTATGPLRRWLASVDAVRERHGAEIAQAGDEEQQRARLVEYNVRDQLLAIARTDICQRALAGRGTGMGDGGLQLHGWVYDLRDGLIKRLMEIDRTTDLDRLSVEMPATVFG